MGKQRIIQGEKRSLQHSDKAKEPHRVASRMEGAVKNAGIREKKKPKKVRI